MCENCKNLFDINKNLPYLIPCGHTICERCINKLEFKNDKMKCPIDSRIYSITKEQIPKNEMLIEYFQRNKIGPKYSYQIRECVIEGATFCHMDTRNCFQKLFHYLYILIYVKIILTIINILLWPFRKLYQINKAFLNLIYLIYLKIKDFCIRIINKIKSINLPRLNIIYNYFEKIKNKLSQTKVVIILIKLYKFTVRAPLWINYLKLMKNLLYESQAKANNICFKIVNIMMALIAIFLFHLFGYLTHNFFNFLIFLILLNESTIILMDFMKMEKEKENKKYYKKIISEISINKHNKKKSDTNVMRNKTMDEEDEEYLIDEKNYHRGKKCILRWMGFIIFWYFFPLLKNNIFDFIKYMEYNKDIDLDKQEKNIQIWIRIVNSLLDIPKLLIIIYLTY